MKSWQTAVGRHARALITAILALLAAVAGLVVVTATPAAAATAPTFEPDPASKGSVSFYDASGNQITGGLITDSPMAAYYAASGGALNPGDAKAYVTYATPQDGVPTLSWSSNEIWTAPSTFSPAPTYPGSLAGTTKAVVKGTATDGGFDVHIAAFANASAANPGVYQVRLYTSGLNVDTYYSSDILVSGTTWTQIYPAVVTGTPTTTTLAVAPAGHQAPGAAVDLTATVTPAAAVGTVQFKDGAANLGTAVPVAAGTATLSTSALPAGSHNLTAAFTPTDPATFGASTSAVTTYRIGTAPAAPTAVSGVAGSTSVKVSWTAPADNGGLPISGYDVQYSSDGGTTWTPASAAFHTSPATSQQVTGLVNGTNYQFKVAAINAIATGAYSAPSAAVSPVAAATKLVQGKSVTIKFGSTTAVSAKLTDATTAAGIAGIGVQLRSRITATGPFTLIKTVATNSSGVASATVKPGRNTQYQWYYPGNAARTASTSGVQAVSVAPVVSINTTKSTLPRNTTVKLWGKVSPPATGTYVFLQRKVGTSWSTATKVRLLSQRLPNGTTAVGYVFSLTPPAAGKFTYRVYRPATSANVLGYSAAKTITVS